MSDESTPLEVLISELRFLEKEMESSLRDVRRAFIGMLNEVLSGSPLPKIEDNR